MARTTEATVYRVGEFWNEKLFQHPRYAKKAISDALNREAPGIVSGRVVLRSAPAPSTEWIDSLKAILASPMTYAQSDARYSSVELPDYIVRLRGSGDSVTVILSSACARVGVLQPKGPGLAGWTTSSRSALALLIGSALPPDPPEARRPALYLSGPHHYRDRDCTCTVSGTFFWEEAPVLVHSTHPALPDSMATGSRERVVLGVLVDREGLPCIVKVESGSDPYARIAVEEAQKWRWKAGSVRGNSCCAQIMVPVDFEPPH